MKHFAKRMNEILKDDSAQGMLEYVMLLAVVAALVLVFKNTIKTKIADLTGNVASSADKVLEN